VSEKKSIATLLVEIACDLFTFGCVSDQRGGRHNDYVDDPVAVYTFAVPKSNPTVKRPLPDIRADIADVYQMIHGAVPNATALGDAMMVLEGKARKGEHLDADDVGEPLLALLGGGGSAATALVKLAEERYRFGLMPTGEAFAVPIDGPNVARLLRGGRRSLRAELARVYFTANGTAVPGQALTDAMLVLEGKAQDLEPTDVALRVAVLGEGELVLDLGTDDGAAVVIDPDGWMLVESSPVLFRRTRATLPLPVPEANEYGLETLRQMLNIREDDWPLILAWLVCALIADLPHPLLLLRGEQGTAKSSAARILTSLIDPCASQLRTAPRNVEDWCVAAAGAWMTCLDNVSDIQPWLSDAICKAITGDGLLRRQLFTDSDVSVLAFQRVVAMTSIDPGRLAGDLADRLLDIELERIATDDRQADRAISARWRKAHPGVLAGLLNFTAKVLRRLPGIRHNDLPRMADYGRIVLAVDQILGTEAYARYEKQAGQVAEQVADSDSVALAIRERITVPFSGTASQLLGKLAVEHQPKDWPTTPQGMGGRLARAAPVLRALGWTVEPPDRSLRVRNWAIEPPADPSDQSDQPRLPEP
jgi:hypothetical protein